ncbi:MFS transporter [soil metagenome]
MATLTSSGPSPASNAAPRTGPASADDKRGSVQWLKALNFSIADVQNGMGPYMALFLQSSAHWSTAQIGTALAFGNIAQVVAQTPAGALIDRVHNKRALIAIGIVMIALACVVTPMFTSVGVVTIGQVLIGAAGAIFPATLAAMALGLVGRKRMDAQMGTNQAFNAAGNVFAAVAIGAVGYFIGLKWMFSLVVGLCVVSLFFLWRIRPEDIDHDLARGADGESADQKRADEDEGFGASVKDLLVAFKQLASQRAVLVFLVCAVIFHFSNAAMVPLVTQMLGADQGAQRAVLYTSGYMLASQVVFVIVAAMSGRLAARIGRKPLFLFAFAMLALRGVLYTLSDKPAALIAVQCMDGLGAGVFGVVGVLIIADLTKGTGRFNAAQGAVATAQGIGAFLSNSVAGYLATRFGTTPTFFVLTGIAVAGFLVFALLMPETRHSAMQADGVAG